jgi:putative intracellular protease/amidase
MSRRRESQKHVISFLIVMIFSLTILAVPRSINVVSAVDVPVEILLILDHDYGGNVPPIITIFERYEWSITTTALSETVTSCDYLGDDIFTVDILMTDISDVTQFDAISIMPGNSHQLLRTNQTSLNLINAAMNAGIVVSAWCSAVRVLAAADVIDGKNITGNTDYEAEYIAAGATFNELVPPVIDGNLVTGVRSRYYREEMCQAIATAVGVFESEAPVLQSAIVTPHPCIVGTNVSFTATFSDSTGTFLANAKIFKLNSTTGERLSGVPVQYFALNETTTEGVFSGVIEDLEIGNYTIDLEVWDIYMNNAVYTDETNLLVIEQTATPDPIDPLQWILPGAVGGIIGVFVIVVLLRRR